MTLQELTKSLSKFPSNDMGDFHIMLITLDENKNPQYHLLGGVGIFKETDKYNSITLLSDEYCQKLIGEGKVEMKPEINDNPLGE